MSRNTRATFRVVYTKNNVTQEIEPTKYLLCQEILESCQSILEARRIKMEEELAAEASKCEGECYPKSYNFDLNFQFYSESMEEAEAYTSLYDDNQYEEIQPEVKFEGLRSVKELLLKVTTFSAYFKLRESFLGAEARPAEADQAGQSLLWGEEEAGEECEGEARAGPGRDHSAGRGQGTPAVQYGGDTNIALNALISNVRYFYLIYIFNVQWWYYLLSMASFRAG